MASYPITVVIWTEATSADEAEATVEEAFANNPDATVCGLDEELYHDSLPYQ